MEIELLTKKDINKLQAVFDDDNMIFYENNVNRFLETKNAYAFVAKEKDVVVGLAYGYSLVRLDGNVMFYLHSIGVLPSFQKQGIGTKMMKYIVSFAKENSFSEVFVITDKGNISACKLYEKAGFENDIENEIVYVLELLKK